MCTNETLKKHMRKYAEIKNQYDKLKKDLEREKQFILSEMETRNDNNFNGFPVITECLRETLKTDELKKLLGNDYSNYTKVTYYKRINAKAIKDIIQ